MVYPAFYSAMTAVVAELERLTIGASDDNVELITILTSVDGCGSSHTRAPKGTLEVGDAWRIVATRSRVDTWISLHVNVEGRAEVRGVAELLALDSIVGLERGKSKVGIGVYGCLKVGKRLVVAWRSRRRDGNALQ